jgi:predicted GIY-YIG superfamily endonuclease
VDTCVYILRGSTGRHYIGSTTDMERRFGEHLSGSCHTTKRLGTSIECIATNKCATLNEARALECRLKRMKNPTAAFAFLRKQISPD